MTAHEPHPRPRHGQGHGLDPAPVLRAQGHHAVPRDARRRDQVPRPPQLLYDEYGSLKCETCFQCAQACPIECIDMGGMDTKGRFHVHWGPPETVWRAARGIRPAPLRPDRPRRGLDEHFAAVRPGPRSTGSSRATTTTRSMLAILEATQAAYGYLPVAALKRISQGGAGTRRSTARPRTTATSASSRRRPAQAAEVSARRPAEAAYLEGLGASLGGGRTEQPVRASTLA